MSAAIVLLSGGLDSATVLAYAKKKHRKICALTLFYGQRHSRELDSAKHLAKHYRAEHRVMKIALPWKGSALLDGKLKVPKNRSLKIMNKGIPVTYVPARNTIFLSYALSWAEVARAKAVYIGANALDYSGYPDCRPGYMRAMEKVFILGTKNGSEGGKIKIQAPLIRMTKAQIIKLGDKLRVPYKKTWSCYSGGRKACGRCDSCLLRAKGFKEAGLTDPLSPLKIRGE